MKFTIILLCLLMFPFVFGQEQTPCWQGRFVFCVAPGIEIDNKETYLTFQSFLCQSITQHNLFTVYDAELMQNKLLTIEEYRGNKFFSATHICFVKVKIEFRDMSPTRFGFFITAGLRIVHASTDSENLGAVLADVPFVATSDSLDITVKNEKDQEAKVRCLEKIAEKLVAQLVELKRQKQGFVADQPVVQLVKCANKMKEVPQIVTDCGNMYDGHYYISDCLIDLVSRAAIRTKSNDILEWVEIDFPKHLRGLLHRDLLHTMEIQVWDQDTDFFAEKLSIKPCSVKEFKNLRKPRRIISRWEIEDSASYELALVLYVNAPVILPNIPKNVIVKVIVLK